MSRRGASTRIVCCKPSESSQETEFDMQETTEVEVKRKGSAMAQVALIDTLADRV